ncbi:RnfH family protein [Luteimonas sp. BDR2-5]|uniref:RnfH family protein n=1 Tax=Proluteimonas luteida TaxID=2878685 RepID=UPI001E63840A|nr:RnfH family protein [Luteimonas sp. BDR2-5]MCD9026873.1 RnfH family protein [Luteimonas sp. BDR2-5]
MHIHIEVILAWPDRYRCERFELPAGATVADALAAWRARTGAPDDALIAGHAVYGVRATAATVLRDGDRLELLRALQADPKDARRRRALKRETP